MRIIYWSSDVCSSDLLKDPAEMARLFRSCPEALTATGDLLACIDFRLDQLEYEYPHEPVPPGWTPQGWLEHLVEEGGRERFSGGLPDSYRTVLDEEFRLIRKKNYARSEENTSELQSLMRISYAVFCLIKKKKQ